MTTRQVAANADDAHETANNTFFSSTNSIIRCDSSASGGTRYNGAFRITLNEVIPSGSTINTCYISVTPENTTNDDANVTIYGEQSADAANFTTTADVTDRAVTTANVSWVQDGLGASEVNSPSLISILQELVDDYGGLANGAGIVIISKGNTDTLKALRVISHDNTPASSPKLTYTFTPPATVVPRDEGHITGGMQPLSGGIGK